MFMPDIPIWEIVIRSLLVFFCLLLLLRLSGKRDVGEMSPSDLILLLLLSANVHTSLSGDDKSILGGVIGATVLMLTNYNLDLIFFKNKKAEKIIKGTPEVTVFNGEPCSDIMKRHKLTQMQLEMALRKEGVSDCSKVKVAVLETDGTISVI